MALIERPLVIPCTKRAAKTDGAFCAPINITHPTMANMIVIMVTGFRPSASEIRPAKSSMNTTPTKYVSIVFEISVVVRPIVS